MLMLVALLALRMLGSRKFDGDLRAGT